MSEAELRLIQCARKTIERHLHINSSAQDSISSDISSEAAASLPLLEQASQGGIFVTLWKREPSGEFHLRGCIGRHSRRFTNLTDEVADCAELAAFQDTRFAPVTQEEFEYLKLEVSLLAPPTPAQISELDPKKFGVIVQRGLKRATLLPEIDGIDSVEQQISMVLRKAGILSKENFELQKFEVKKISELP